jgi:hypothetical protein
MLWVECLEQKDPPKAIQSPFEIDFWFWPKQIFFEKRRNGKSGGLDCGNGFKTDPNKQLQVLKDIANERAKKGSSW